MTELYKAKNLNKGFGGDWHSAGQDVANNAFKIAVSANFLTGLMEMAGCALGSPLRKILPSPAMYSLMTGVGFTYLAFGPMIQVAAEPIVCVVPLLIILAGFFGGVKYKLGNSGLTIPIALVAILTACILGWAGGCKHKNGAIEMYNYGDSYSEMWFGAVDGHGPGNAGTRSMFGDTWQYSTCTGTSKHDAKYAYRTYAGDISSFGSGIFADLSSMNWNRMKYYFGIIIVVGVVGFSASLACVESASAAGDDYPMTETLIIDGVGTCLGACFGSFFGTTVYIGHPIHKSLGARRGYSAINGMLYFVLLWSGLFASLYKVIPGCAPGALLIFVGLVMCQQAVEDNPPRYYPAIFFGLFPCLCNWAKLYIDPGVPWNGSAPTYKTSNDDFFQTVHAGMKPGGPDAWWNSMDAGNWGSVGMGIKMMGQGGGEWFTLVFTAIFSATASTASSRRARSSARSRRSSRASRPSPPCTTATRACTTAAGARARARWARRRRASTRRSATTRTSRGCGRRRSPWARRSSSSTWPCRRRASSTRPSTSTTSRARRPSPSLAPLRLPRG